MSRQATHDGPRGETLRLQILGSGTSHGVPMIGCDCEVCASSDPRDRRHRSSALISRIDVGGEVLGSLLIDTTPELRVCAIACGIRRVDAVALTHSHADHILGMDDLRRFNNLAGRRIDCHANAETLATVKNVFSYADRPYKNPDRPSLNFVEIDGPFHAAGMTVTPIPLMHGRREILGYRVGPAAYCTDCSAIPTGSLRLLAGLELLVINALRYRPHPAHFNLDEALEAVAAIKPRRALLTHIAHEIMHQRTSRELPEGVELAYDGMRVELAWNP